jgi:hypothetical protein
MKGSRRLRGTQTGPMQMTGILLINARQDPFQTPQMPLLCGAQRVTRVMSWRLRGNDFLVCNRSSPCIDYDLPMCHDCRETPVCCRAGANCTVQCPRSPS